MKMAKCGVWVVRKTSIAKLAGGKGMVPVLDKSKVTVRCSL